MATLIKSYSSKRYRKFKNTASAGLDQSDDLSGSAYSTHSEPAEVSATLPDIQG